MELLHPGCETRLPWFALSCQFLIHNWSKPFRIFHLKNSFKDTKFQGFKDVALGGRVEVFETLKH
jgi:hypothetical protein